MTTGGHDTVSTDETNSSRACTGWSLTLYAARYAATYDIDAGLGRFQKCSRRTPRPTAIRPARVSPSR